MKKDNPTVETNVSEAELLSYVDNRLDSQRVEAVEKYIKDNPEIAELVSNWQEQNAAILSYSNSSNDEKLPNRFKPHYIMALQKSKNSRLQLLAASVVFFMLGGWLGSQYFSSGVVGMTSDFAFSTQAINSHALYSTEIAHPVEVDSSEQEHLLKWLSKRLNRTLVAPNLDKYGFVLMGGRLLPSNDIPAAQLMYEDQTGKRITLYILESPDKRLVSFRYQTIGSYNSFYWLDSDFGYALVGDLPKEQLRTLATNIYKQLV